MSNITVLKMGANDSQEIPQVPGSLSRLFAYVRAVGLGPHVMAKRGCLSLLITLEWRASGRRGETKSLLEDMSDFDSVVAIQPYRMMKKQQEWQATPRHVG